MSEARAKRIPASEKILAAASGLFYTEGIRAVGVEAVAAEAGVTKKTLYDNYGSKGRLVAAYLEERDRWWRGWVLQVAEQTDGSPEERILSSFDALGGWMNSRNPRGCGFVNAAAELPDADHPARAFIRGQKEWMLGYLAGLSEEAGVVEADALAERLMILHEGATVVNSLDLAQDAARKAKEIAALLIETVSSRR